MRQTATSSSLDMSISSGSTEKDKGECRVLPILKYKLLKTNDYEKIVYGDGSCLNAAGL